MFSRVKHRPRPHRDHALAAAFVLLLLFVTPFTRLWATPEAPWYLPYLLWGAVIALLAHPGRSKKP